MRRNRLRIRTFLSSCVYPVRKPEIPGIKTAVLEMEKMYSGGYIERTCDPLGEGTGEERDEGVGGGMND